MTAPTTPAAHEYVVCRTGQPLEAGLSVTDAVGAYEGDDGTLQAIYCHVYGGDFYLVDLDINDDGLTIDVYGHPACGEGGACADPIEIESLRYQILHHSYDCDMGIRACRCDGDLVEHTVHVGKPG